jgi:hypothetical protein
LLKKRIALGAVLVYIDCDNDKATGAIYLLKLRHPGERQAAWHAPGRPEIEIDYFSLIGAKIEILGVCRRGGEQDNE